ncbi:MAG: hypothetical protein IJ681_06705 [Bacteroidales bacterium]|nr:hypothetical protein [Bacteroidales bacterium]
MDPLDSLFDPNSGCILTICKIPRLTRKANLTKIIFFEDEVGLPNRIGLIARSRLSEWEDYFIDFKDSGWYTFYKTTKHHLLDIVKTENKVAVLGMNYYHGFDLFSHERQNTHYYTGRYYQVGTLIDSYIDPRIHFKAARSEKDHVVVISERNTAEIRLDVVDLNSMFYVNSQEILGGNTGPWHSKLIDFEFDHRNFDLYCLMSGNIFGQDFILHTKPYATYGYPAEAVLPNNNLIMYNLLSDMTLYNNDEYCIAVGKKALDDWSDVEDGKIGPLYWFDIKLNTTQENGCYTKSVLPVEPRGSLWIDDIYYDEIGEEVTDPDPFYIGVNYYNLDTECLSEE